MTQMVLYKKPSKAEQALQLARKTAKEVNRREKKKADSVYSAIQPGNTGTTENRLTGIAQGDQDYERSGNQITVTSISGRLSGIMAGAAVGTTARFVIVQDLQQISDVDPGWADVFSQQAPEALLEHETVGRFRILYDKVVQMSNSGTRQFYFKFYKKCNVKVRYNGANATDHQKNGIYFMHISNEATTKPSVWGNIRLNYTDN